MEQYKGDPSTDQILLSHNENTLYIAIRNGEQYGLYESDMCALIEPTLLHK